MLPVSNGMTHAKFGLFASAAFVTVGAASVAVFSSAASPFQVSYVRVLDGLATSTTIVFEPPSVVHVPTPVPVKAIYMTQCVVGTPSLRDNLVTLIEETELNSVVIDIKDYSGGIAFPTTNPKLAPYVSGKCGAWDMKAFIEILHEKDIYVIGRITVFQDPIYANRYPEQSVQSKSRPGEPWKDHKGLSFVAVNVRPFWEYIVELSKESYALGFDELNYDYIRWPSDGPMDDVVYPSNDTAGELEKFFQYLHEKVGFTGVIMSADLFGMVTTNIDDLNIGQVLERALPYFNYVSPMVYPSHYPKGFRGYTNVNEHPYDIVNYSMRNAVRRVLATTTPVVAFAHTPIIHVVTVPATATTATTTRQEATGLYEKPSYPASVLRPWLQSFDYPVTYTPDMVKAQIEANKDAGLDSWMFWDPANKYRSLRQVLTEE
jgi:hypothetical protein